MATAPTVTIIWERPTVPRLASYDGAAQDRRGADARRWRYMNTVHGWVETNPLVTDHELEELARHAAVLDVVADAGGTT